MGWFNTMLNVATAASSAYSATQLHSLRQQHAEAAAIQAILAHLRNQVFQLKQMAESALSLEAESPKVAAGALSVVEMHLQNSGITPDMFPDLADKEYAMQTVRLVVNNLRRLTAQLTPAERAEVQKLIAVARRLPDYNYYLENFHDGRRLAEAAPIVEQYAGRNGWLLNIALGLSYYFVGLPASIGIFMALFTGGNWSSNTGIIPGLVVGIGAWVAGLIMISRWQNAKEYKRAKKVVDELKDKIDLPRFTALDNEFGEAAPAQKLQAEAQRFVDAFFGDTTGHPAPAQLPDRRAGTLSSAAEADAFREPGVTGAGDSGIAARQPDLELRPPKSSSVQARRVNVSKRSGTVQTNVQIAQAPADDGTAAWIVWPKGQTAGATDPLGEFRCPWCDKPYRVSMQPAHLEFYCLACGQGIALDIE